MKPKNNRFAFSIVIAISLIIFSFLPSTGVNKKDEFPLNDPPFWSRLVSQYLKDDLWENGEAYDAANVLMIPMFYSFYSEDDEKINEFSAHFGRFLNSNCSGFLDIDHSEELNRLQYLYLMSRFFAMASQNQKEYLIPQGLPEYVRNEIAILWSEKPAKWYGGMIFDGGVVDRLNWKLSQDETEKKYYKAIADHELFLFAIAADIRIYDIYLNRDNDPLITEILDYSYRTMKQYGKHIENDGWTFQPGIWSDHGDYLYAGNYEINENMQPLPVDGIAEDSSHSHRWPVWLMSLADASCSDNERYNYYLDLRDKLENQFFNKVVVLPNDDFSCYRMNNFMDGNNGVYRYGYATQGANNGYGPYELSGTLIAGWWGFSVPKGQINCIKKLRDVFLWLIM